MSEKGKCDICGRNDVEVARVYPPAEVSEWDDEILDLCKLCSDGKSVVHNTITLDLWEFEDGEHFSQVKQTNVPGNLDGLCLQGETTYRRQIGGVQVLIIVDPNWLEEEE